jgi:hypothetical protein
MPVIGYLHSGSSSSYAHLVAAFRQGLRESGYEEGRNVAIDFRWAEGRYDRLPALAADLVSHRPVTTSDAALRCAPARELRQRKATNWHGIASRDAPRNIRCPVERERRSNISSRLHFELTTLGMGAASLIGVAVLVHFLI